MFLFNHLVGRKWIWGQKHSFLLNMTQILFLVLLFALGKSNDSEGQRLSPEEDFCEVPSLSLPYPIKSGVIDPKRRWPNNTISYIFHTDFPYESWTTFLKATDHIMGRTCIRFKHLTYYLNDTDFIFVTHENNKCSSKVGRMGNQQNLSLATYCATLRTQIHELVHAIGFYHEHARSDRDQFVVVNLENVISGKEVNFETINDTVSSPFGVPYDYNSIMHYKRDTGTKIGKDTITPLDPDVTIGVDESLSDYDIKKINNMYCLGTQGMRIQNLEDGKYLTVSSMWVPGRPVKTFGWDGTDVQKWTIDWLALQNRTQGSYLGTWSVDRFVVEVLSIHIEFGNVGVWAYYDPPGLNQTWFANKTSFEKNATWQLMNLYNSKCLQSMGTSSAVMTTCNATDPKQLWKMYNV